MTHISRNIFTFTLDFSNNFLSRFELCNLLKAKPGPGQEAIMTSMCLFPNSIPNQNIFKAHKITESDTTFVCLIDE